MVRGQPLAFNHHTPWKVNIHATWVYVFIYLMLNLQRILLSRVASDTLEAWASGLIQPGKRQHGASSTLRLYGVASLESSSRLVTLDQNLTLEQRVPLCIEMSIMSSTLQEDSRIQCRLFGVLSASLGVPIHQTLPTMLEDELCCQSIVLVFKFIVC